MINTSMLNIKQNPFAVARIKGSSSYPAINGTVYFYKMNNGIIVSVEIKGLPTSTDICNKPIFAIHIHSGNSCTGTKNDPFSNAMTHYNPNNCSHPYHAGDMPPIFACGGLGFLAFLTDRFSADEIIGKTIILHSAPDDFTTQPSGNAGEKIACGVIVSVN